MDKVIELLQFYHPKRVSENTVSFRKDRKDYVFAILGKEIVFGESGGSEVIARDNINNLVSFVKRCVKSESEDDRFARLVEEARSEYIDIMGHRPDYVSIKLDNAKGRWGNCTHTAHGHYITVARRHLEHSDLDVKNTILHEFLHTEYGCQNHGTMWKAYASRFLPLGYHIKRTNSYGEVRERKPIQHAVQCPSCKKVWTRTRESNLTLHPETYKCRNCKVSLIRLW